MGSGMAESSEEVVIGFLEFTGVGSGSGKKELKKKAVVVGRQSDVVDVVVADDSVSRKHAELVFGGGRWLIRDMGSSGGTFVDGKQIDGKQVPLSAKNEVRIGSRGTTFRVKLAGKRGRPRKLAVGEKRKQLWRPGVHTITERDLAVLEWVAEERFSTAELLVRACFSSPDPKRLQGKAASGTYGSVRIAKLIRDGFLTASQYRLGKMVPLLLSLKGYSLLHGQGRVEWAQFIPELSLGTIEHELLIQDLRLKLTQLGVTKWRCERFLSWKNCAKQTRFVPDACFEAGGSTWYLEIERSLKAKKRRAEALELRSKVDARFLYVVPESIWEAVKETVPMSDFESGIYWLSEANARQGRLTVKCKWSESYAWQHEMPLVELLAGKFEPELVRRRRANAEWEATEAMGKEFSDVPFNTLNHTGPSRARVESYAKMLSTRNKGVLGFGADKISPLEFPALGNLPERYEAMKNARRRWIARRGVDLAAYKNAEQAFAAYVSQLSVTETASAKAIEEGKPTAYGLPTADALEKAVRSLSGR